MNRDQLQSYIYTEKLLAQLYRRAAALATMQSERDALLAFARDAEQNANYLNYFYRLEFGTAFDPMIPDVNQGNAELRETMRAITDNKLGHILTILAIVTNMNTPGQERKIQS